ncbi:hypothetical protein SAMN06265348_101188 [Pedobacter westerhofensis]|uniref:Uncharacterized protein n=1 Tax=Pedobacter westerhofensis TaxID=425512 RepID=A0A521AGU4_9SPHI|nr:hypothetical protein [Pedobacter westerhofensis]SMO34022.1 hypothetical protein SAMN06265348_101188 [Pedobacter westerhofensis]
MAFSFNQFFGCEQQINAHKDLVVMYGFAAIFLGLIALAFLSFILGRLNLTVIIDHFIGPMVCSLILCLGIAILPTIILYVVASDVSGVKLLYCWITIFAGVTFFCFSNNAMIRKFTKISKR